MNKHIVFGKTAKKKTRQLSSKNAQILAMSSMAALLTACGSSATPTPTPTDTPTPTPDDTTGTTYTLKTTQDTIVAESKDDTFIGVVDGAVSTNSTLTASDDINGGAGNDTLNVTVQGAFAAVLNGALVSGIETINVRNVSGGNGTLTATNASGVTLINSNLSTSAVIVNSIADTTSLKVTGNGVVTNNTTAFNHVGAAKSADVTFDGGVTGASGITITGTGLTSVAIGSTGAKNTVGAIAITPGVTAVTIDAASALTSTGLTIGTNSSAQALTISGAGKVTLGTLDTDFATVNASANSGGLVAAMSVTTSTALTGTSANDTITTGIALGTGSANAGAGTGDKLIVAASGHLATSTLGGKYTNFEVLQLNDGVTVDLDNISGITSLILNDTSAGAATVIIDATATQAGAITALDIEGSFTVGVKGAATVNQLDVVSITVDDGDSTASETVTSAGGDPTLTSIETLNLIAVDDVFISTLTNAASLTNVNISGAGDTTLVTRALAINTNSAISASGATGNVTINAVESTGNAIAVTGGSGNDTLILSAAADLGDIVIGGAGNDTIFANGAFGETQTVQYTSAVTGAGVITVTIAGTAVAVTAAIATAIATATATATAINSDATLSLAGYSASSGGTDTVTITAPANTDFALVTIGNTATGGATTVLDNVSVASIDANAVSDTITGGEGKDVFGLSAGGAVTVADSITDLDLGSSTSTGTVDTIIFGDIGTATVELVVTLTGAQQTAVTGAASLAAAVVAVLGTAGGDGNVTQFTYGTDSYIVVNGDGDGTYDAGDDLLVKVTGVTGTLDISDFTFGA